MVVRRFAQPYSSPAHEAPAGSNAVHLEPVCHAYRPAHVAACDNRMSGYSKE